jgi:hypothetical protein
MNVTFAISQAFLPNHRVPVLQQKLALFVVAQHRFNNCAFDFTFALDARENFFRRPSFVNTLAQQLPQAPHTEEAATFAHMEIALIFFNVTDAADRHRA